MDCSSYKLYHEHEPDSRTMLETYYSGDHDMTFKDDALMGPTEKLHNTLSMGHMTGEILIDISSGPLVHHLYSACEFFREIILMRTNEKCIMEIMKWHDDRTGAFSWGHVAAHVTNLEGRSDECEAKEMKLKSAITHVVKFDTEKESLTELIGVPQADCIFSYGFLDLVCKDQEDYKRNLRKILNLLKPGGHLILHGALNASYYTVGEHKFHALSYDETFASNALLAEGMTILQCEVTPRKSESHLTDYDGVLFSQLASRSRIED
ncbi:indolethylamine N-methyltransferase-like [Hyperolius riggenbachi]|uniref:indolethylamine N-methyltransferase-like n=1 Tax=Hyperolius riggenbachi TaxID=752182 RepID=UPI0035A277AA